MLRPSLPPEEVELEMKPHLLIAMTTTITSPTHSSSSPTPLTLQQQLVNSTECKYYRLVNVLYHC
jgi:hypothetical protein